MNNLINLILLLFCSLQTLSLDPSLLRSASKQENKTSTEYPAFCDNPAATTIDPEKCCKFPDFFDDSIEKKCEEEFGPADKSTVGDMVTDSCLIECMFNKSGINKGSKLTREDVMKVMGNKTKSDNAWNQLVTKAVDACFNELSDEDIEDIAAHIQSEVGKSIKSISNKICHPASSIMLDCIYRELYKVCPKEKFAIDISECSILQNYTKACDDW